MKKERKPHIEYHNIPAPIKVYNKVNALRRKLGRLSMYSAIEFAIDNVNPDLIVKGGVNGKKKEA